MKRILVTGASGYIASRLIPRLLEEGYRVCCLARQPQRLRQRAWYPRVETVAADVTRPETLSAAMDGVNAAYYLIHSMAAGRGYHHLELESARNFAQAARSAGVEHIIYLGGLADERDPNLALHLRSRIESGAALREAGVPVTEFRAGVIVGAGSVSFEMIRFIAEQFPVMVGPAWTRHKSQPIATQNVLDYLIAALTVPACRGKIVEIGGGDVMTYAENLTRFAALRGLKRGMILLPVVPLWFMAFFIGKLTPVDPSYAFPLMEGLRNDSLVLDSAARDLFPAIQCLGYAESVRRALADLRPDCVERIWLDLEQDDVQMKHEGMLINYRRVTSAASAESVFAAVCRIAVRERQLPSAPLRNTEYGTRLAYCVFRCKLLNAYRIEVFQENFLRVRAELKIPGAAWMEWRITPQENGCILEQTVFFAPKGLPGFLYWVLLNPFHRLIFDRLAMALSVDTQVRARCHEN